MSCHPSPRAPIEADLAHAHTVVDVVASGTIRWCVEDVSSQPIFRSNGALALLPEPFVAGQRWRIALRTYDAPAAPEGGGEARGGARAAASACSTLCRERGPGGPACACPRPPPRRALEIAVVPLAATRARICAALAAREGADPFVARNALGAAADAEGLHARLYLDDVSPFVRRDVLEVSGLSRGHDRSLSDSSGEKSLPPLSL